MDKKFWQDYQDWRTICGQWSKIVYRDGPRPEVESYSAYSSDPKLSSYRAAQQRISMLRKQMGPSTTRESFVKQQDRRIRSMAHADFSKNRSRTSYAIIVSKEGPLGQRVNKGSIKLFVGFMWLRNVHEKLYQRDFDSEDYLILQADEMRVNSKHVRLFECVAYNQRLDETKRVYIAEKITGNKQFYLNHTINSALNNAEDALSREVQKTMIGENDDQNQHG